MSNPPILIHMMRGHSKSAEEFLEVRHQYAQIGDTNRLEKIDEQLLDMATSESDQAAAVIIALSHSDDLGAKEAAAIFARYLFATRPEIARELLMALLFGSDSDAHVKNQALSSIDFVTQHPTQGLSPILIPWSWQ